jgi:hypothetical protein
MAPATKDLASSLGPVSVSERCSGAISRDYPKPVVRCLRGYAIDPSLRNHLETAPISTVVLKVAWEPLDPGPIGEYVEVVDYDPASKCRYEPVNLDDPRLLAQGGYARSEGVPQFHQKTVYAVSSLMVRRIHARELLARTIVYKVGHHSSHNATAVQNGLEMMTNDFLVALIQLDNQIAVKKKWPMPAEKLYERLLAKTKGRVLRSDLGWPEDSVRPSSVPKSEWQKLSSNTRIAIPNNFVLGWILSKFSRRRASPTRTLRKLPRLTTNKGTAEGPYIGTHVRTEQRTQC